jgi:hypothetical protein
VDAVVLVGSVVLAGSLLPPVAVVDDVVVPAAPGSSPREIIATAVTVPPTSTAPATSTPNSVEGPLREASECLPMAGF